MVTTHRQQPRRLVDVRASDYPFHHDRYHRLHDELHAAAGGFAELSHGGVPSGRHLYELAAEARDAVQRLWQAVQDAERTEREQV